MQEWERRAGYIAGWIALFLAMMGVGLIIVEISRAVLRRQRLVAGLCRHCGYDLRASTDRCPECGETINPISQTGDPR